MPPNDPECKNRPVRGLRRGRPTVETVAEVIFASAEPSLSPRAAAALLKLLQRAHHRMENLP